MYIQRHTHTHSHSCSLTQSWDELSTILRCFCGHLIRQHHLTRAAVHIQYTEREKGGEGGEGGEGREGERKGGREMPNGINRTGTNLNWDVITNMRCVHTHTG